MDNEQRWFRETKINKKEDLIWLAMKMSGGDACLFRGDGQIPHKNNS